MLCRVFYTALRGRGELKILGGIRHFAAQTFLLDGGKVMGSDLPIKTLKAKNLVGESTGGGFLVEGR